MAETVAVFTFESIDRILNDGGTSEWRVNRHRAQRCVFTVCTRNRYPKVPTPREGTEPHRSAFLLGRVRDVVTSPGPMPKRYLIQFSKYALLDIPEVWVKGTEGGVRYKTTLEEFGIDTSELEWKTMPAPSAYRPRSWSKWVLSSFPRPDGHPE